MAEYDQKVYELNERISAAKSLSFETERNIVHLNTLVSEYVTARDNEIKKKEQIQKNLDKLIAKLKKLIKSNKLPIKGPHTEFVTDKKTDKELDVLIKKLKKSD